MKAGEASKQREQITYLKTFIPDPTPAQNTLKLGVLGPQHRQSMDILELIQGGALKMTKSSKLLSYQESLREPGIFSLEKRGIMED